MKTKTSITNTKVLYHSKSPFEVLRDTIIINRPFSDQTEFEIIAFVNAMETGTEVARYNAEFIVEAMNHYAKHLQGED